METQLAIASKRDTRSYRGDEEIPDDALRRILQAGRITGSGKNRQQRRFVVLRERRRAAAQMVTRPSNVRDTPLTVAVVTAKGPYSGFDAGRAAQNMMLAAWDEGIASCPNAIADPDGMSGVLGTADDEQVAILISFGQPASDKKPSRKTPEEWYAGADRLPLAELVEYR